MSTAPVAQHRNAFGFLRLVLAALVIIAHTPEMVDGNRSRELLTMLTGTTTFGGLAVNGFFVISGFLITASFLSSRTPWSYIKKRMTRLYPGFLVAYLLCILIVAPLGGGQMPTSASEIWRVVLEAVFLQPPRVAGSFAGTPYPALNGAMWTIAYEFRCYLLVMLLGVLGMLRSRRMVLAFTVGLTILTILMPERPYMPWRDGTEIISQVPFPGLRDLLFGNTRKLLPLFQIFMVGSCFYLYRDKLRFSPRTIMLALVPFIALLFHDRLADIGNGIFFGYFLIGFAHLNTSNIFSRINNKDDISYGVYLAGWPMGKLLILWLAGASLPVLATGTILLAGVYGLLSWRLVEYPVVKLGRTRRIVDLPDDGPPKKLEATDAGV